MKPLIPIIISTLLLLGSPTQDANSSSGDPVPRAVQVAKLEAGMERNLDLERLDWLPARHFEVFASLSAEELQQLGVTPGEQEKLRGVLEARLQAARAFASREQIDLHGCLPIYISCPGDSAYVLPEEMQAREPSVTIEQLINRSHVAVLLRISETEPGLLGRELVTRVRGEAVEFLHVDETLKDSAIETRRGATVEYFTPQFDFKIAETRLCTRPAGPAFLQADVGDLVLLLGTPRNSASYYLNNVFPVSNGIVQPQPYDFLAQQPFALDQIWNR